MQTRAKVTNLKKNIKKPRNINNNIIKHNIQKKEKSSTQITSNLIFTFQLFFFYIYFKRGASTIKQHTKKYIKHYVMGSKKNEKKGSEIPFGPFGCSFFFSPLSMTRTLMPKWLKTTTATTATYFHIEMPFFLPHFFAAAKFYSLSPCVCFMDFFLFNAVGRSSSALPHNVRRFVNPLSISRQLKLIACMKESSGNQQCVVVSSGRLI